MIAIGFRTTPHEIYYSIVEMSESESISVSTDKIIIPVSLDFPEKLNFLRTTVKDILFEFQVRRAGIRVTEATAERINVSRVSYEAILQEVICNSTVQKYFVGQISNISANLGIPRTDFKKIATGEIKQCKGVELKGMKKEFIEATLSALASINI